MRFHANKLLVEGKTDQQVIPYLMEHNGVTWPEDPPVYIESFGSVDEIMKPGVVEAEFKASRLEASGSCRTIAARGCWRTC